MNRASGSLDMVGICAVVNQDDDRLFLPDKLWCIEAKKPDIESQWLFLTLTSPRIRAGIEQFASGNSTGMKNITQGDFLSIEVAVPPLPEQRKIARILGAWDRELADLDALIGAKRRRKQGLAQRLLTGRMRVPGFEDQPLRTVAISEIAAINPRRPEGLQFNSLVSFVGMADVSENGRLDSNEERPYMEVSKGYTPFMNDDVLVAKITPCFENGKGCLATGLAGGIGFGSTEFHVLRASPQILPGILHAHTRTREFRLKGEAFMSGSGGQQRVGTGFFDFYQIKLSPIEEQRQIAAVLDAADAEIAALEARRDALAHQKKGLMQRLLSGEIRVVPDAEDCHNSHTESDA